MSHARLKGTLTADASDAAVPTRTGSYGEAYTLPVGTGRQWAAVEGSYFVAQNATLATEIAGHAAPAIGDEATKPLVYLYNGSTTGKIIVPDFIWMRTDTPNASSTASYFVASTTQELSRDSGGTAITPNSTRSDAPYATSATVYFGAVVCTPAASKRVGQVLTRSVIAVTEDQYLFTFGQDLKLPGFSVSTGTTVADRINGFPPCAIAPGGEFLFTLIAPSGAATAWDGEITFGWYEF